MSRGRACQEAAAATVACSSCLVPQVISLEALGPLLDLLWMMVKGWHGQPGEARCLLLGMVPWQVLLLL
jgi:hypothetical protein